MTSRMLTGASYLINRPELLSFWYRQSRKNLIADNFWGTGIPGVVTFDDPPLITSGMVDVWTDDEGRLGWFQAIPDEKEETPRVERSRTPKSKSRTGVFCSPRLRSIRLR